jgi:hypothetical protein
LGPLAPSPRIQLAHFRLKAVTSAQDVIEEIPKSHRMN